MLGLVLLSSIVFSESVITSLLQNISKGLVTAVLIMRRKNSFKLLSSSSIFHTLHKNQCGGVKHAKFNVIKKVGSILGSCFSSFLFFLCFCLFLGYGLLCGILL